MRKLMVLVALALVPYLGLPVASVVADPSCSDAGDLPVIGGVEMSDLDDLIERGVVGADGRWVGIVKDIVLNGCGVPATMIVSVAAAAGTVAKDVSIDIRRVRFLPKSDNLRIYGLTRAEIAAMPSVEESGPAMSLDRQ